MRFPQLSFAASAGVLAAIGAAALLTACAWGESPNATGARMIDDSLLSYQVKAALDQDTALNTRQIRIRSTPDGKVTLTGWVDTPEMARRAGDGERSIARRRPPAREGSTNRSMHRFASSLGASFLSSTLTAAEGRRLIFSGERVERRRLSGVGGGGPSGKTDIQTARRLMKAFPLTAALARTCSSSSTGERPSELITPFMAPLSRRWRTRARVSMPWMPITPWPANQS